MSDTDREHIHGHASDGVSKTNPATRDRLLDQRRPVTRSAGGRRPWTWQREYGRARRRAGRRVRDRDARTALEPLSREHAAMISTAPRTDQINPITARPGRRVMSPQ